MTKRLSQEMRNTRKNFNISQSQNQSGSSSQTKESLQSQNRRISSRRKQLQDSQNTASQDVSSNNISQTMHNQEKMQIISGIIKYLFMADQSKQPIQKSHIIKHIQCNPKDYNSIIKEVEIQLSTIFGYKLLAVEGNKYIMVNQISNNLPHLNFKKSTQILLFLILVHIFMLGESCKEEMLWDFLRNMGIITCDSYTHEYFGDIKQLVTVDFINHRYLEKIITDQNDPTTCEYKWGFRALHELTYRSALEFVAQVYGASSLDKWKLQYKSVKKQEQARTEKS